MLRALVVDDHPVSLEFMRLALTGAGLDPTLVTSGPAALLALERHRFDVLFIDWLMPGMTGVEVVKLVRDANTANPPHIIMLTSKTSDEDLVEAFDAGVDDFMRKPISGPELRARLSAGLRILSARRNLTERLEEIRRLHAQLEASIVTDPLTELPNRHGAMRKCAQLLGDAGSRIMRAASPPLSAAVLDIDDFRSINSLLGEARGDATLRFVAGLLREAARTGDFIARTGCDEFLALFPATDTIEAAAIVDLCARRINDPSQPDAPRDVRLSVSAGIATTCKAIRTPEELIRAAYDILADAKRRGGNQIAATDDLRIRDPANQPPREDRTRALHGAGAPSSPTASLALVRPVCTAPPRDAGEQSGL